MKVKTKNLISIEVAEAEEQDTKRALVNVIMALSDVIKENAIQLAHDWAEKEGQDEPDPFMLDKAEEILTQSLVGYMEWMQPRANQFTDKHASAYLGIAPTGEKN